MFSAVIRPAQIPQAVQNCSGRNNFRATHRRSAAAVLGRLSLSASAGLDVGVVGGDIELALWLLVEAGEGAAMVV